MNYIFYILLLCTSLKGFTQDRELLRNKYKHIIVNILVDYEEKGSGFIIGKSKDSIYIITAKHVVKDTEREKIEVNLEGFDKPLDGKILYIDTNSDIALIVVLNMDFQMKPYCSITNFEPGNRVFFINSESKIFLPVLQEAYIDTDENKDFVFTVNFNGIKKGDSGSALFVWEKEKSGIVGMIIETGNGTGEVISVKHIKNLIIKLYKNKWELCEDKL